VYDCSVEHNQYLLSNLEKSLHANFEKATVATLTRIHYPLHTIIKCRLVNQLKASHGDYDTSLVITVLKCFLSLSCLRIRENRSAHVCRISLVDPFSMSSLQLRYKVKYLYKEVSLVCFGADVF
jgi:hypothetical protein